MKYMPLVWSPTVVLLAIAAICVMPASAQQVKAGDLVLDHAWARATPGGATVGGGFLPSRIKVQLRTSSLAARARLLGRSKFMRRR